jgi:hypothetical protein
MYQAVLFWSGFLMISELLLGGEVSRIVVIGAVGGCVAFALRSERQLVWRASVVLCIAGLCVQSPLSVMVAVVMAGVWLRRRRVAPLNG